MPQFWKDSKLPSAISYHVCNDSLIHQRYRISVKRPVAQSRYSRNSYVQAQDENCSNRAEPLEMKMDSVPLPPKLLYCCLQYLLKLTAPTCVFERLQEHLYEQGLRIMYVYWQVPVTQHLESSTAEDYRRLIPQNQSFLRMSENMLIYISQPL